MIQQNTPSQSLYANANDSRNILQNHIRSLQNTSPIIALIEILDQRIVRVLGFSANSPEPTMLTFEVRCNASNLDPQLPDLVSRSIDPFLGRTGLLCWKQSEDLTFFLTLAKKYTKFRIRDSSVVLPDAVSSQLSKMDSITLEQFVAILKNNGLSLTKLFSMRGK